MKKKNIIFIIFLMTFALVGLVFLQLYWVNNAVKVEEVNFSRNVNEASSVVILKLEKMEIAEQFRKHKEKTSLINTIDSLNRALYHEQQKYPGIDEKVESEYIEETSKNKIDVSLWENIDGETVIHHDTSFVIKSDSKKDKKNENIINKQKHQLSIDESILDDYRNLKRNREQLLKRSSLVDDFFENIFNTKHFKPIEKRIEPILLDSLISQELKIKGIQTEYEFGIYSPSRGQLIVQKTGKYSEKLLSKEFGYVLFPSDMYVAPEYLLLYFPKEKSFLLYRLWLMLFASIVLILIIIFSFSYTVTTIFKQKKLSEMKSDFVNNMTHEIKTPLSTISLACEVLSDKEIMKSETLFQTYINIIKEENKRLESLAEHILQTSTLEKGQLVLRKEEIDIHNIIPQAVNNVGFHVMQKNGQIHQQLNAKNSKIIADKIHITNLIYNLLDNANKYTPDKPKIIVNTENTENGVIISVCDNGIGISHSNQKKIFEKLFRVSTGNIHDVKGFGLGLSYVKALVDMHGGNITIESELKKGSTFKIYLPFGYV